MRAAPWERAFSVESFAPAAYYGGKAGTDEKASDCPNGVNPGMNVAAVTETVARTPWRTDAERKTMIEKAALTLDQAELALMMNVEPVKDGEQQKRPRGQGEDPRTSLSHRAFAPDINSYFNPMASPDPGMQEVTSTIAYGFDLDDNPETGGFSSPDGVSGIDNAFYRALGCTYPMRGAPGLAYEAAFSDDHMRDGLHTLVIRVTGLKDPMDDDDVSVEMGYSPDDLVKDARGGVAPNYSFRLDPSTGKASTFKAKIVDGVLTARDVPELRMNDFAYMETLVIDPLVLQGARLRLKFNADGTAEGLVGGYRTWTEYYIKDAWTQPLLDGGGREIFFRTNLIGTYHALSRNAAGRHAARRQIPADESQGQGVARALPANSCHRADHPG